MRNEFIIIKVTEKEKEILKKKANEKGLALSTYIRYELINRR